MKTIAAFLLSVAACFAAVSKISMPTDFSSVSQGTRANLKANFDEIQTKSNPAFDSLDEVRGRFSGYSGELSITSLDNMRLRLDSDGSSAALFYIANGATADTLFRVSEDSTWRAFGNGIGTKLTLSDSLVAADGAFGGLNLSDLTASLPVFTNGSKTFVSNAMTGTGNVVMSASPTLTGTVSGASSTWSGTVTATGLITANGGVQLGVTGAEADGKIFIAASGGLKLRGYTGSSYDVTIEAAGGNDVMRVPTGTSNVQFPNGTATFGQAITASSTLGVGGTLTVTAASLKLASLSSTLGIQSDVNTSYMSLSGGNASNAGANLLFYGGSHATLAGDFYLRDGSTDVIAYDKSATKVTVAPPLETNSTFLATGKAGTADSLYAEDGLRVGATAASNVNWNRASANMWTTPDSVTIAGRLSVGDSLSIGGNENFGYDEGSFTATLTGCTTTPTTTVYFTRIGKNVTLKIGTQTCTSNASTFTMTGLPSGLSSSSGAVALFPGLMDNGSVSTGLIFINGSVIEFSKTEDPTVSASNFTSSGTKGTATSANHFTYNLQ